MGRRMGTCNPVWLEALLGNDDPLVPGDLPGQLPGNQQGEGGITGLDDLRHKWSALEQRWTGHLAALTPEATIAFAVGEACPIEHQIPPIPARLLKFQGPSAFPRCR